MRKILLNVAISLDGLIEGPSGEYDWCLTDQDYGMSDFLDRTDAVLFGRKSYELLMRTDSNARSTHKRYVFSRKMQAAENATVINNNLTEHVEALKHEEGKDIWLFGGAELSSAFLKLGLIDELHLAVHPLLLGEGKPLFEDSSFRTQLRLLDNKTYSSGLAQLIYEVIH